MTDAELARDWRLAMDLSRPDAARVAGVSVRQWRRYERGEKGGRVLLKHWRVLLELLVQQQMDRSIINGT